MNPDMIDRCNIVHPDHGHCVRAMDHKGCHVSAKEAQTFMWLTPGEQFPDAGKKG